MRYQQFFVGLTTETIQAPTTDAQEWSPRSGTQTSHRSMMQSGDSVVEFSDEDVEAARRGADNILAAWRDMPSDSTEF